MWLFHELASALFSKKRFEMPRAFVPKAKLKYVPYHLRKKLKFLFISTAFKIHIIGHFISYYWAFLMFLSLPIQRNTKYNHLAFSRCIFCLHFFSIFVCILYFVFCVCRGTEITCGPCFLGPGRRQEWPRRATHTPWAAISAWWGAWRRVWLLPQKCRTGCCQ